MTFAWKTLITMQAAVSVVAISAWIDPPPQLMWNASASLPIGFYAIRPASQLRRGDVVAVAPPEPLASFFADGGYLPRGVPLLKHVVALPGQRVCRDQLVIRVDDIAIGSARLRDSRGRALPTWQGCRVVAEREIFLMNPAVRDSLDGRYFGPIATSSVIGRATPLWTDLHDDGRHRWRASAR
jgi:conjugative transfer signal peptidase TraF